MKAKTTKGYEVFALKRWFNAKTLTPTWSGKIRLVEGNPYFDEYFAWYREPHRNGVAIEHDKGDLTGEIYE